MKREENPAGVILFGMGILAGSAITFFEVGGRPEPIPSEIVELEEYEGAIILMGIKPKGAAMERTINLVTGRKGFSHCALHVGITDADENPLLVDSTGGKGVNVRPLDYFGERPIALIPLQKNDAIHARAVALQLLGKPYRGRPGGMSCAEFVAHCLPRRLQNKITRFPTPNDLAVVFEVPGFSGTTRDLLKNPGLSEAQLVKLLRLW